MTDQKTEAPAKLDVTDLILRDISAGALPPGTWLKQIDLERRYGATRPDVRRALDRLVSKRLVEHIPNRGYHVFEPDGRQAAEVADLRTIIETGVADRIVAQATPADIAALRTLAERFDHLVLNGTVLELYEANLDFHRRLLGLCGNAELVRLVSEIRQRTSSAPVSQWRTRARIDQSSREHHQMVDAIAAGAVDEFRRLTALHINQG